MTITKFNFLKGVVCMNTANVINYPVCRTRELDSMYDPIKTDMVRLRVTENEKIFLKALSNKLGVSMSKLIMDTVMETWKNEVI